MINIYTNVFGDKEKNVRFVRTNSDSWDSIFRVLNNKTL